MTAIWENVSKMTRIISSNTFGLPANLSGIGCGSDQIQIKGATIVSTPEPGGLALLGTGLMTLVGTLRKKQAF